VQVRCGPENCTTGVETNPHRSGRRMPANDDAPPFCPACHQSAAGRSRRRFDGETPFDQELAQAWPCLAVQRRLVVQAKQQWSNRWPPPQARALLLEYVAEANDLARTPRSTNCTTQIFRMVRALRPACHWITVFC
jgi:hypothetical protein